MTLGLICLLGKGIIMDIKPIGYIAEGLFSVSPTNYPGGPIRDWKPVYSYKDMLTIYTTLEKISKEEI